MPQNLTTNNTRCNYKLILNLDVSLGLVLTFVKCYNTRIVREENRDEGCGGINI